MCVYQRCPQTVAEIVRNMDICCGFRAVASREKYPGFILLSAGMITCIFQASMMQRVTNMEMLKLSYWNPAKDMLNVLVDIKAFLQHWARYGGNKGWELLSPVPSVH